MKRQLSALLLLASVALGLQAQKTQPVDATQINVRRHIEYLASDKLEGRRTGEPGANAAAAYVASEFAKIKLRPASTLKNGKPSYMQSFPYVVGIDPERSKISIKLTTTDRQGKEASADEPEGFLPVGFSPKGSAVNAPVSFAGYGIVAKEADFDDYGWQGRPMSFKDDVVVVFDGNPDNDNPHSAYGRFDVRTKALIAKEHGAVGMLVITREAKFIDDKLTGLGYDQSLGEAAIPTFIISREVAAHILGVNESSLKTIEELAGKKKDGLNSNVGFREVQPRLTFSVDLIKHSVDAYNVVGRIEGTDPQLRNEAIVIGAHYDHLGHGGPGSLDPSSGKIHHGADDNASGTAAVIELARQFAAAKNNKRTLIFIAFSGEEEGLFGSNYYVNNPLFPLGKTVAMINLDMVGRLKENKLTVGGIGSAAEWKDVVAKMNTAGETSRFYWTAPPPRPKSLSLFLFTLQLNEDGFGPSDHSSFYGKKVPVLFFFTGTHNEYHKPTDTADLINYAGESQIISYIRSITQAIDQNPTRPTYTLAKTTTQGGRSGFNISLGTIPNYADSDNGLLLDGVRDGSPAGKAGVKAGDRIIKLAGHEVRNVKDYTFVLGEMKADTEYDITVFRGTETINMKITPVRRQ